MKSSQPKEDLYTKVILWIHDKQESGFTFEEMRKIFGLNHAQEEWIKKIFLTTNDSDRKFVEVIRNDESSTPNVYYYSLNEKGMAAAVNYLALKSSEKDSNKALWFAGLSLIFSAFSFLLTLKQTNLNELQSIPERMNLIRDTRVTAEFCKQNPNALDSGFVQIPSGKSMSCDKFMQSYNRESLLNRIKKFFNQLKK